MEFCSCGEKMRNVSGHQDENERRSKKSDEEHVEVSRSFMLKSCKTTAKKCTKKVCCTCLSCSFANQTYCCFFTVLVMSIYRARTRARTSRQDSTQNSKIFHFSPLRGGVSWQSWSHALTSFVEVSFVIIRLLVMFIFTKVNLSSGIVCRQFIGAFRLPYKRTSEDFINIKCSQIKKTGARVDACVLSVFRSRCFSVIPFLVTKKRTCNN